MGAVKSLEPLPFIADGRREGLACKITMQFKVDWRRETNVQVHRLPLPLQVDVNCAHALAITTLVDLLCIGDHRSESLVHFIVCSRSACFINVFHELITCVDAYYELFS